MRKNVERVTTEHLFNNDALVRLTEPTGNLILHGCPQGESNPAYLDKRKGTYADSELSDDADQR
jgi:hypothetical protein